MKLRSSLICAAACGLVFFACGKGDGDGDPSKKGQGGADPSGGAGGDEGGGTAGEGGASTGGSGPDETAPNRLSFAGDFDCEPAEGEMPFLMLRPIVTDFSQPLQVAPVPGDDEVLWVIEQSGRVYAVRDEQKLSPPVLDIRDLVGRDSVEQGLLGLAVHPKFQENGLFYVHYSADVGHPGANLGDTVVAEYRISDDDPNVADPDSGRVILVGPREEKEGADHNGGGLFFGADDLLHLTLGDGGGVDWSYEAQDVETYLGTILRFDPTGTEELERTAPDDNYFDADALPEIWAYGLRNPFRGTADGCTGDVYIGDVGLDSFEEVNVLEPDDSGKNFGWPILEGDRCWETLCVGAYAAPAYQYATVSSGSAVVGGSVYRGSSIPALRGRYFFGDTAAARVRSGVYDRKSGKLIDVIDHTRELTLPVITSIQNDNHGEIYFTSRTEGGLYRLEVFE